MLRSRADRGPAPLGNHGGDALDEGLVERVLGGDKRAFEVIVERHLPGMHRLAWRYLRDSALAEEVTQEALTRAWSSLGTYRGESGLRPWLYRIVANLSRDLLRSASRREQPDANPTAGLDAELGRASLGVAGEANVARRRALDAVEEALELLPEAQREVLLLRLVEGLPYEDISRILDVPVGALKVRVHRARQRLKDALGGLLEGMWEDAA